MRGRDYPAFAVRDGVFKREVSACEVIRRMPKEQGGQAGQRRGMVWGFRELGERKQRPRGAPQPDFGHLDRAHSTGRRQCGIAPRGWAVWCQSPSAGGPQVVQVCQVHQLQVKVHDHEQDKELHLVEGQNLPGQMETPEPTAWYSRRIFLPCRVYFSAAAGGEEAIVLEGGGLRVDVGVHVH